MNISKKVWQHPDVYLISQNSITGGNRVGANEGLSSSTPAPKGEFYFTTHSGAPNGLHVYSLPQYES